MNTIENTASQPQDAAAPTATVELPAGLIANLRRQLEICEADMTAEDVITEWLEDTLTDPEFIGESVFGIESDGWVAHPRRNAIRAEIKALSEGGAA